MLQIEQTDPETGYRTVGAPKHPARYAQYRTALQEHFLRRFLALVLFLDKAKTMALIPANPLLFNKVRLVAPWAEHTPLLTPLPPSLPRHPPRRRRRSGRAPASC